MLNLNTAIHFECHLRKDSLLLWSIQYLLFQRLQRVIDEIVSADRLHRAQSCN